jgi:hypothetical protein
MPLWENFGPIAAWDMASIAQGGIADIGFLFFEGGFL